ncbi:MAG: SpoIIE family protein phosphatase [Candidatus Aminicenantes bacterium]|nr:MAG: SpoIIE family protein phosphatase [Candidatus Aminicenantes bacterium]
MKKKGIAFKLIVSIMTGISLIFILIFGYNYLFSRRIILKNVEESAKNLAIATTNQIDKVLLSMQEATENLARFLEHTSFDDKEQILNIIQSLVEHNPEIYGSTIAFEPYAFDKKSFYFAPYYYKSDGEIKFTYLGGEGYNYFYWTWYQIPKELNHPVWSEPYYDEGGGNIIMSTYSVPFYKSISGKKQFLGILTADISLTWLQEIVSSIKIYKSGYAFLISRHGIVVTHPFKELIMNETLFSVAEARGDAQLREIGRDMIKGKFGFVPFQSIVTGRDCWMAYRPIPSSGWSLGVIFPQDELLTDIVNLNKTVIFLGGIGFLLLMIIIVLIAGSITRPLRILAGATKDISKGNLDIESPRIKSKDEVGKLAESLDYMKSSLKQYIKDLTETTAAKERIESELNIAREIQMSILPKIFPPFPQRSEFDIYATIEPAKEVGGDFYDFFFIDEDLLCFVIGDVSGKGVPASLFMAVTKTLLKASATKDLRPDEIILKINDELSQDNESCMFVTLFFGIFNAKTGEILFTNAGHNPPLLVKKGEKPAYLDQSGGVAVGAVEGMSFKTEKMNLEPGEYLFMYTDGVTEATNKAEELFSEDRLKAEISIIQKEPIQSLVSEIMKKITSFSQGMPQADDITMMVLKFHGQSSKNVSDSN